MGFKNKKFYNLIKGELVTTATQLGDTHCWYVTYNHSSADGTKYTTYDLWSYRTFIAQIDVNSKEVFIDRSLYWDTWRYTQSSTTKRHYRRFMQEIVGYGKEEYLSDCYIGIRESEYDPTKHGPYMYE